MGVDAGICNLEAFFLSAAMVHDYSLYWFACSPDFWINSCVSGSSSTGHLTRDQAFFSLLRGGNSKGKYF